MTQDTATKISQQFEKGDVEPSEVLNWYNAFLNDLREIKEKYDSIKLSGVGIEGKKVGEGTPRERYVCDVAGMGYIEKPLFLLNKKWKAIVLDKENEIYRVVADGERKIVKNKVPVTESYVFKHKLLNTFWDYYRYGEDKKLKELEEVAHPIVRVPGVSHTVRHKSQPESSLLKLSLSD